MSAEIFKPECLPYKGKGVVFTNGCFDILHAGHVRFLQRAADFGETLVVAVNSDASVRRLKGKDRPINTLEDRLHVIAALACVDAVTWFETNGVDELLWRVKPHCWIKAGYTMDTLDEKEVRNARDAGTAIVLLEKFGDYSTTAILDKLKG